MDGGPFVSHGQNNEDVVLWRALKDVHAGRYVEVGCHVPNPDSITRSFYDQGWSGVTVDVGSESVDDYVVSRPRDMQVHCVVAGEAVGKNAPHSFSGATSSTITGIAEFANDASSVSEFQRFPEIRLDSILEATNWSPTDIQFMVINVAGAQHRVLKSIDLSKWRPWVLVIDATRPDSDVPDWDTWEGFLLSSGYQFCLFDGVSRFYVSDEKAADLKRELSYPACSRDEYIRYVSRQSTPNYFFEERAALTEEADRRERELMEKIRKWRRYSLELRTDNERLKTETDAIISELGDQIQNVQNELAVTRGTTSWRITKPLRVARKFAGEFVG